MRSSAQFLNPSEAAKRLGVSAKALRLYERQGLVAPHRTAAGWRVYGPDEMVRAGEIAALRGLGLTLAEVAQVLEGNPRGLEPALAAHQASLQGRIHLLSGVIEKVRELRADLARGKPPRAADLARLREFSQSTLSPSSFPGPGVANDLNCATYARSTTSSARSAAARRGWPNASLILCPTPPSLVWSD